MSFMWIVQFLVLQTIFVGVVIFILKRVLFSDTESAVNRLNRDTEAVRAQQKELADKIKLANEELQKRRAEADALVKKMTEEAEEKAKEEREKLIVKARQESEEIINKAQRTRDDLRKNIEKEMQAKTVDFVEVIINEVLSKKARGALNDTLISEFLDNLDKTDMDMLGAAVDTAEIFTAEPLAEPFRNRLSEILQKKLGRTVKITVSVNAKVLSGAILSFGSLKLDGSLQSTVKEAGTSVKDRIEKGLLNFSAS
ncbi:MAG: F0F1 ATP synthase subunit delta [Candidatus Omnitrophota bacterium]|nr:F0F1 ATP synthase subunit delta [Candidatus Omnitrophota bacterium]MDZ4241446.1 F0F1 ATP synthase subunit delta [Candidatus Omnitrophota bacterium]